MEPSEHLIFYCFTLQNATPCPSELSTVGFLGWLIPGPGTLVYVLVSTLISVLPASCSLKWFPTGRVLGQAAATASQPPDTAGREVVLTQGSQLQAPVCTAKHRTYASLTLETPCKVLNGLPPPQTGVFQMTPLVSCKNPPLAVSHSSIRRQNHC